MPDLPPLAADDPFGLAMAATGALSVGVLMWLAVARVRGGRLRIPSILLGLALVGFLGAAAAGTAQRIRGAPPPRPNGAAAGAAGPRSPSEPSPAPTPETRSADEAAVPGRETEDGGSGGPAEDAPRSNDPPAGREPTEPQDLIADMRKAAAEGDYLRVGQRYRVLSAMEPPPKGLSAAWKEVAPHRTKAVRQWIADALEVARGRCTDADAILGAFQKLRTVAPAEPTYAATRRAVARLEDCRRRYGRHLALATKRERMAARRDFARKLEKRLRARFPAVRVTVGGRGVDARIRIAPIPLEEVRSLFDDGTAAKAQALGFGHMVFSDGRKSQPHALAPEPDRAVAEKALHEAGLGAPLSLDAGP